MHKLHKVNKVNKLYKVHKCRFLQFLQFFHLEPRHTGVLMVLLLVSVIMSAVGTAVLEMYTARRWIGTVTHAFKIRYEGKVQEARGVLVSGLYVISLDTRYIDYNH